MNFNKGYVPEDRTHSYSKAMERPPRSEWIPYPDSREHSHHLIMKLTWIVKNFGRFFRHFENLGELL